MKVVDTDQIEDIDVEDIRPIFNGFWNKFAGLFAHDVDAINMKLLNFTAATSNRSVADVEVEITDHVGLDLNDAKIYQSKHGGFAGWYLLQHTRSYRPFVNKMVIQSRISWGF